MKKFVFIVLLSFICSNAIALTMADDVKLPGKMQQLTEPVNINTASLEQLITLPGIGKSKAKAIVDYRNKNGNFKSLEELGEVSGIGKKLLSKLDGKIVLE